MENDSESKLVSFQLGKEVYAIDIMDVKEVVKKQEVREIPNAPAYVEGILNLRGVVTPIINLQKRFYFEKVLLSEEDELLSGFIIIEINNMIIGIIIDKILKVISIQEKDIQPPPKMIAGIGVEYIEGVIKDDDNYIIILNISKLFNPRELQQLSAIKE